MSVRWLRWALALLGSLSLLAVALLVLATRGLEQASAAATVLGLLSTGTALIGWARRPAPPRASTADQVDAATRTLALAVRLQWRQEVAIRQLADPQPLAVRWRPSELVVGDDPDRAGVLSGRSDRISDLAAEFARLPGRRLVVLGGPGAGKTSLTVLLTLELCERRKADDPVPVLLPASSWDPAREPLRPWIERRLREDYPDLLDAEAYGPAVVPALVRTGRVLPVVDGLDELPERHRGEALRRINQALIAGDPLVVTCRTSEFEAAVAVADVIRSAAVVEAEPVRLEDASDYLAQVVPPGRRSRWDPLFVELCRHPEGTLATVFSNPLMVWLVRTVYVKVDRDPAELLELLEVRDITVVEDRLLDALLPALLAPDIHDEEGRTTDPEAARRWLGFLAHHLDRLETRDLAWWRIPESVPPSVRALLFGCAVGLVLVPVIGGLLGLATGLVFGTGLANGQRPSKTERARTRWLPRIRRLAWTTALLLAGGLVAGGVLGAIVEEGYPVVFGLQSAVVGRLAAAPACRIRFWALRTVLCAVAGATAATLAVTFEYYLVSGFDLIFFEGGLLLGAPGGMLGGLVAGLTSRAGATPMERAGVETDTAPDVWPDTPPIRLARALRGGFALTLVLATASLLGIPSNWGISWLLLPESRVELSKVKINPLAILLAASISIAFAIILGLLIGSLTAHSPWSSLRYRCSRLAVPERRLVRIGKVAVGLVCMYALGWWVSPSIGASEAAWLIGLTAGLVYLLGLVAGFFHQPLVTPAASISLRLRGRVRSLSRRLLGALVFGLVVGPTSGAALGLLGGFALALLGDSSPYPHLDARNALGGGLAVGLLVGLELGVIMGVARGITDWMRVAPTLNQVASPAVSLRNERVLMLTAGAAAAVIAALASLALEDPPAGAQFVVLYGWLAGTLVTLMVGLRRPWLSYHLAVIWLAACGQLPWRPMRFLQDAHRRGILRQVGGIYQFRHARLQDRLAQSRSC